MMQFYLNHGLNALDQRFEKALQNIPSGQSKEKLENRRDREKDRLTQSVYEHTINIVEKQVVADIEQLLPKMGNKLTKHGPDKMAQDYANKMLQRQINRGLSAVDEKFEQATQNLRLGESSEQIAKIRDGAKEHILQSVYEHTAAKVEQQFAEETVGFFSKMGTKLTTPKFDNVVQDYISRGLQALDEQFELVVRNRPAGKLPDALEKIRDNAKGSVIQSVHEHTISLVGKQLSEDTAEFFFKEDTSTTPAEFDNLVQGYLDNGLNKLDKKFEDALKDIPSGQSLKKLEKARDSAKGHFIHSVYEHTITQKGKKFVENAVDLMFKENPQAVTEVDNMAQGYIDQGLQAIDELFAQAMKNARPGQSLDGLEKTRDSEKGRIVQSVYEHTIAMVEKQFVEDAKEVFSKTDTFTQPPFHKMVQDYIKFGSYEIDQRFEHALKNLRPEQSPEEFEKIRDSAKEHLTQSIYEVCRSEGWSVGRREDSNLEWESPTGPIMVKRGISLQQLKLNKADIASGAFGSVSIFENENGVKLIGKISKNKMKDEYGNPKDDLADELKAYQTIYDAVGPHPNLVNAYGIAKVPMNGEVKRAMLMDAIPGPTGTKAFDDLANSWYAGKISSEEYWGAIQFIGRRLLDVTEHLGKAGIVHNDIKPENFLVNEMTGEPVLIDLGVWSKEGEIYVGGTPGFASPEAGYQEGVDERSDVFTVGASLLDGIDFSAGKRPDEGIVYQNAFKDADGNVQRESRTYAADTAYTKFMNRVLADHKDSRVNSAEAKNLDFLGDSMLDDDAAKEVIKKALSLARMEESKPIENQWEKAQPQFVVSDERIAHTKEKIDEFVAAPKLAGYAKLKQLSKTDPELKKFLDREVDDLLPHVKQDVDQRASKLLMNTDRWLNNVKNILDKMPEEQIKKSRVDENGIRLKDSGKEIDPKYARAANAARMQTSAYIKINDLRRYADEAKAFIDDAATFKEGRNDPQIEKKIQMVQQRAAVAKQMVEIIDANLSPSKKPKDSNIQDRANELEPQIKEFFEQQLKRRR